jgi:hypothetical protein
VQNSSNSGRQATALLDAVVDEHSPTSTPSESSTPDSGRHHWNPASASPESAAVRELVEALVSRNRRQAWTPETHVEPREPLLERLDRWMDRVHQRVAEIQRKVTERRSRRRAERSAELADMQARVFAAPVRDQLKNDSARPARTRFDGPLPKRQPMVALKEAVQQTVTMVHPGDPVRNIPPRWYRFSASQMIPILVVKN